MPFVIIFAVFAVIAGLYLLALKPRPEPKTSLDPMKVPFAHRGLWGRDEAVENTMSAFRAAERCGYGIELDVRLTSDGEIAVFHDETLERMCGRPEKVSELTGSELSWVDVHGTYDRIPMFEDVLASVGHDVPLLIELKGTDTALCEKVAKMLDGYDGYFAVQSFNPFLMNWFRKERPRFLRGQLTATFSELKKTPFFGRVVCSSMMFNFLSKPDFISCSLRARKRLPALVCRRLYHSPQFVWTVESKKDFDDVKASGAVPIFQKILPETR